MCKVVIAKTNEISHEDWLALRQKGIGGSEAAAVCGFNRYCSPLEVWLRKTERKGAEVDNEAMYFGRLLEPVLREEFSRRTNLKVQTCPFIFASKKYPFMIANIDGVVNEKDGTKHGRFINWSKRLTFKNWSKIFSVLKKILCTFDK